MNALAFVFCWTLLCSYFGTGGIEVQLENVHTGQGTVYVALYNQGGEDGFPGEENWIARKSMKPGHPQLRFFFDELPAGEYAIAVYHDLNENNTLDTNWFGFPKEPYGFSNNFKPKFSPPKFSDCKIKVASLAQTVTITLID